ncbi:uncharacterized protein PFL1_01711 [Pseudozyma flocculosa PF-1]|uniref:uncharacterized protein n=1 Tax=Pseudozyma flocculosa PF-1 TaxID=1277687 RepID=UPI0004560095|nr:uncharacterized protein PFL1_01711 [Pseudozyma flocculosa PF-1]EPQ30811.1 hypothetical protein PFL1_01711 [Pseudozyma flocculosa PF-1]
MTNYALITFSALSCFLVPLPFPWHWRAKNVGTLSMMAYLILSNIDILVNTSVWAHSFENLAPAWCEISIRIRHLTNFALLCCNLCIARRLESIASTREVRLTEQGRRRRLLVDLFITVGLPIVHLSLMIVNQGHRFDVLEGRGCWPSYVPTAVYLVLVLLPWVFVCIASLVYSILAFRWFIVRRRQFAAVLQSTASHLNKSRYLRMMMFSIVDILFFFPLVMVVFVRQTQIPGGLAPYKSWGDVHYGFDRVSLYPAEAIELRMGSTVVLDLTRWTSPISGIFFFLMFGLGEEAIKTYKRFFQRIGLMSAKTNPKDTFTVSKTWIALLTKGTE